VEEATDRSPANGALVRLHPHDLTAVNTEAHVSAGEHHGVLGRSVANDALLLALIRNISCIIIDAVNVIQVHNLVIIEQLLLQEFET
jgi:hypothetical protein